MLCVQFTWLNISKVIKGIRYFSEPKAMEYNAIWWYTTFFRSFFYQTWILIKDVQIKMFYKATYISKHFFHRKCMHKLGRKSLGQKHLHHWLLNWTAPWYPVWITTPVIISTLWRCWIKSSFVKSVDICCLHAFNSREKRKFICTHRSASKQLHHCDIHHCFHA